MGYFRSAIKNKGALHMHPSYLTKITSRLQEINLSSVCTHESDIQFTDQSSYNIKI